MSEREELEAVSKGNGELVEAVRQAIRTFRWYAENHAKKGTIEGNTKAARNIEEAERLERALSDSEGVATSAKPKTAAEIAAIVREWLDSDDPTHWGKFETDLDAALEGVSSSGRSGGDHWQPIETAPKDGRSAILLWGDGQVLPGSYLDNSGSARPWAGWRPPSGAFWPKGQPTHWMPLPTPPAQDTQRAERATNGDHHDEG